MSAHDLTLLLIYRVPAVAFGLVFLLTLAVPAIHSLLVVARVTTGRPANINWWVIGRVLPLVLAAIVAVPLTMAAQRWTTEWQVALAEVALIYLSVAVVFIPIALPLVQAYVARLPRFGTIVYAFLAVLSMPVAAALATQASVMTTLALEQSQGTLDGAAPAAFALDPSISACKIAAFRIVSEGLYTSIPPAEASLEASYPPYFFFWVDMTLKAALLDFVEVFECGLTNLRHNPDHVMISSFVFAYRAFVSLIVLAVLALPFRRRLA